MKLFLGPSLFRRYLATTIAVVFGMALALVSYFVLPAPDPEWIESDMLLFVRALDAIADNDDVESARANANKVATLNTDSAQTKPEPSEVQYAIYRNGQLFLQSGEAPLDLLASQISKPQDKATLARGWYVRGFKREGSATVSLLAVKESYARRLIRAGILSGLSFALLVYAVFAVIVAFIGSYFALRPIVHLTRRIRELNAAQFETLHLDTPFKELMPVVSALNDRTQALKSQMDAERVFFSNAAHELRTPLAVINAQAHGVSKAINDEDRTQRVGELQSGVERAARALGRMLHLARLDAAAPASNLSRINLGEIAADCVAFHAPRAFSNDQNVSLQENALASVFADRDDVITIFDNLLENAVNYAGRGATIIVDVGKGGDGWVYFSVTDDGPGFSADDHAAAFERFRRGSQSQSQAGSGLGLAIVKAAAGRVGGTVAAGNVKAGGGLCVKVSLPAA
jgi:two-component system, OmpR family, sensor histidine kinase QseC